MPIQIIGDTNVDFIGKRKIAFLISGALVALGLVTVVMLGLGKGNLGIQFIGGTMLEGYFEQPIETSAIRSALANAGFTDAEIQQLHGRTQPNSFLVRVKADPAIAKEAGEGGFAATCAAVPG